MTAKTTSFLTATLAACFAASPSAFASVNISSAPTRNVACSAGTCSPTAKGAILNVTELENLLATSDVTVNTGSGAVTIEITAPLTWASTHRLTLNADMNVSIKAVVAVEGKAGLTVDYNNAGQGGQFQFFPGGKVDFWDTQSVLSVNGLRHELVNDLRTLAGADPYGAYAFAKDYDAGPDGSYQNGINSSIFQGVLEGLGHTISNLSINGRHGPNVGMFVASGGVNGPAILRDFALANVNIQVSGSANVGALVGEGSVNVFGVSSSGTIVGVGSSQIGGLIGFIYPGSSLTKSSSSASVTAGVKSVAGGLVGLVDVPTAPIVDCHATGTVSAGRNSSAGGLVGFTESQIDQSFATGNVQSDAAVYVGGLAGEVAGTITNSYATGAVLGGNNSRAGGLAGYDNNSQIARSYSAGEVAAPGNSRIGGFIGKLDIGANANDYWDVDTSGQNAPCHKACSGITGLSDAELKSGLPPGFDPAIWAQSASVNNGYPYLIANPPQ